MTKKSSNEFKVGNYVVYPTHGVGKILAEETQKIGEVSLKVFVISFEKDKMTLRVPVHRATAAGRADAHRRSGALVLRRDVGHRAGPAGDARAGAPSGHQYSAA